MKNTRSVRKWLAGALCAAAVLGLAVFIWARSPGPQWMARRTAQRYLAQYAPEYSYLAEHEATDVRCFGPEGKGGAPIFSISRPTWVIVGRKTADDRDTVARLELGTGYFPWRVTDACYFSPETGAQEALPVD